MQQMTSSQCAYTTQGTLVCARSNINSKVSSLEVQPISPLPPRKEALENFTTGCDYGGYSGLAYYGCESRVPGITCNQVCVDKGFSSGYDNNGKCQCKRNLINCTYETRQHNNCTTTCESTSKLYTNVYSNNKCTCCQS